MGIGDDITDAKARSHQQKTFLGALQHEVRRDKLIGFVQDATQNAPSHLCCHQTQDVINSIQLASSVSTRTLKALLTVTLPDNTVPSFENKKLENDFIWGSTDVM
eukprot:6778781-Ditylum_brightwellii.AAC.1